MGFGIVSSLLGQACLCYVEEGLQDHCCILTGMCSMVYSPWSLLHLGKCLVIGRVQHWRSSFPVETAFYLFCKRSDPHLGEVDPIQDIWFQLSIPPIIHILNCYEWSLSMSCQILQIEVVIQTSLICWCNAPEVYCCIWKSVLVLAVASAICRISEIC